LLTATKSLSPWTRILISNQAQWLQEALVLSPAEFPVGFLAKTPAQALFCSLFFMP